MRCNVELEDEHMIKLKKETMTVEEWLHIEDCPIQRDTERHARAAVKKHLSNPALTHANVSAARLKSGEIYKLDGHTRAYLWANDLLKPPSQILYVDMYYCDNISQVKDLYQQFDNKDATEHQRDKLYGAFRMFGFKPKSSLISNGGISSALSIILGIQLSKHSTYKAIVPFIDAIKLIDEEDFPTKHFPSPVLATLIVSVYKDGEKAMKFWRAYANDEGVKNGRERDGVQALTEMVHSARNTTSGNWGFSKKNYISGRALSAYLAYQENRTYVIGAKTQDFGKYVSEKAKITRGTKAA